MIEGSIPPVLHSSLPIGIAGAGIIGLSIALRLAEAGWKIEVFDQGTVGGEASWAGAGMLAPGGSGGRFPLGCHGYSVKTAVSRVCE